MNIFKELLEDYTDVDSKKMDGQKILNFLGVRGLGNYAMKDWHNVTVETLISFIDDDKIITKILKVTKGNTSIELDDFFMDLFDKKESIKLFIKIVKNLDDFDLYIYGLLIFPFNDYEKNIRKMKGKILLNKINDYVKLLTFSTNTRSANSGMKNLALNFDIFDYIFSSLYIKDMINKRFNYFMDLMYSLAKIIHDTYGDYEFITSKFYAYMGNIISESDEYYNQKKAKVFMGKLEKTQKMLKNNFPLRTVIKEDMHAFNDSSHSTQINGISGIKIINQLT